MIEDLKDDLWGPESCLFPEHVNLDKKTKFNLKELNIIDINKLPLGLKLKTIKTQDGQTIHLSDMGGKCKRLMEEAQDDPSALSSIQEMMSEEDIIDYIDALPDTPENLSNLP